MSEHGIDIVWLLEQGQESKCPYSGWIRRLYLVLCRMQDTWRVPGELPERRARNDHSLEASYSE